MKKLFAMAMALSLALSLAVPSFAADVTVKGAVEGEVYTAYKVFDYTNDGGENYSYTIQSGTKLFEAVKAYADVAENCLTLTESAGVPGTYFVSITTGFSAADFAAALNLVKEDLDAANSVIADEDGAEFIGLGTGYYFIDSSLGSLCALQNDNDDVVVVEKNAKPTLTKTVKEDSNGEFGPSATADIEDVVEFKLTVGVGSEPVDNLGTGVDKDYVIVDTLPAGMTYVDGSAEIEGWVLDTDFVVEYVDSTKELTITLDVDKLATVTQNTTFDILYKADMDTNAVIDGEGNKNVATMTYGTYEVEAVNAIVYTYAIDIFKYTGENKALADADFILMNGDKYAQTLAAEEVNGVSTYTFQKWVDAAEATTFTSPASGKIQIKGLDAAEYTLIETEAPAGYNLLSENVSITIEKSNVSENVQNNTGLMLPSTGGMGTTIFYSLGGMMVVAAGVLLVTKKRMNGVED